MFCSGITPHQTNLTTIEKPPATQLYISVVNSLL